MSSDRQICLQLEAVATNATTQHLSRCTIVAVALGAPGACLHKLSSLAVATGVAAGLAMQLVPVCDVDECLNLMRKVRLPFLKMAKQL